MARLALAMLCLDAPLPKKKVQKKTKVTSSQYFKVHQEATICFITVNRKHLLRMFSHSTGIFNR